MGVVIYSIYIILFFSFAREFVREYFKVSGGWCDFLRLYYKWVRYGKFNGGEAFLEGSGNL